MTILSSDWFSDLNTDLLLVRRFVDVGSGAVVPRDETTGAPDCRWAVIGGERSRDPDAHL